MAHITRIKVEGLLGREEPIEISLDRHVNIFFGENGCGKTTILKVMQSALAINSSVMESLPVEKAEVDIYSIERGRTLTHKWERKNSAKQRISFDINEEINNSLVLDSEIASRWFRLQDTNSWKIIDKKKSQRPLPAFWSHRYLPTTRLYAGENGRRDESNRLNTEERINAAFAAEVNKRWLVYYSQTLKEVKQIQEEGLRSALHHSLAIQPDDSVGPNINPEQAYLRVKQFLNRQDPRESKLLGSLNSFVKRYESDEPLRRIVDNINNVELRIESAMAPIRNFTETINNLFSRGKKVKPIENGLQIELQDGKTISPALLSSGEKHLLLILLNAMTADQGTIIIDEPELSMHIDWQFILAKTISELNPNCQLILASHSPEIMAMIEDDKIFKL